MEKISKRRAS